MTHDEAQKRLTEWVSGELGGRQGRQVAQHIAECPKCAAEAAEVRALWASLSDLRAAQPPRAPAWPTAPVGTTRENRRKFTWPSLGRPLLGPALGLAALLAALAVPSGRWMATEQVRAVIGSRSGGAVEAAWQSSRPMTATYPTEQRYERELYRRWFEGATRTAPDSFELQFGRALVADARFPFGKALQGLEAGFPGQPAADAAVIQQLSRNLPHPVSTANGEWQRQWEMKQSSQLLNFREEMDGILTRTPEHRTNAFFALMDAVYWRTAADLEPDERAEEKALAALHRAASLRRYEDYTAEQAVGMSAAVDAATGYPSAFARWGALHTLPLPYGEEFLRVSEGAQQEIVRLEKQGHGAEALTARNDLLAVGEMLVDRAGDPMAQRAGYRFVVAAAQQPGGSETASWQKFQKPGDGPGLAPAVAGRQQEATETAWAEYATRHGRPDLLTRYRNARDRFQTQDSRASALENRYFLGVPDLWESLIAQGVSGLLLGAVVWSLLLGGIAGVAARYGRGPVPPAVGWGVGVGVLSIGLWMFRVGIFAPNDITVCLIASVVTGGLARSLILRDKILRRRRAGWFVLTMCATATGILAASVVPAGIAVASRAVEATLASLTGSGGWDDPDGRIRIALFSLLSAAPSLAILLGAGFWGTTRERGFGESAIQGFRKAAPLLVGGLLLLYAASLLAAAHLDAEARSNLEEMYRDRNRYTQRLLTARQDSLFGDHRPEGDAIPHWTGSV